MLNYFTGKFRRFFKLSRRTLSAASTTSYNTSCDTAKSEEYEVATQYAKLPFCAACNASAKMKMFLEILLRNSTKKGNLYVVPLMSLSPVLYKAYLVNNCLYLLSADECRIERMVYI